MKKLVVALAVCACGLAQAQVGAASAPRAASPAKQALITRVLALQQPNLEALAKTMAERPAARILQQAGLALQQAVPADKREAAAKDIEAEARKYADEAVPIVRDRAIKLAPSTVGVVLDERFTEEELGQLITLLESPVNRKYQSLGGEMMRTLGEKLVNETRPVVDPKVKALEQAILKRLQVAAPGIGASAPKK